MNTDLYSILLLFAMASLAVAVVGLSPIALPQQLLERCRPRLAAVSALVAVSLALFIHLVFGHNPDTANGLSAQEFFVTHPAPLIIGGLSLLTLLVSIYSDAA